MAEKFYLNATMDYKGDSYFPVMNEIINLENFCYTQENIRNIFNYDENNILCVGGTKVFVINKVNMNIEKTLDTTHDANGVCYDRENKVLYYICKTDMSLYKYDFSTDENTKMDVDFGSTTMSASSTKIMDKTGNYIYIINNSRLWKISLIDKTVNITSFSNTIYASNDKYVYGLSHNNSTIAVNVINKEDFNSELFKVESPSLSYSYEPILCTNEFIFMASSNNYIYIDLKNKSCVYKQVSYKYVLYKENVIGINGNTIYKIVQSTSKNADKKISAFSDSVNLTDPSSIYYVDNTFYVALESGIYNTTKTFEKSNYYKKLEV